LLSLKYPDITQPNGNADMQRQRDKHNRCERQMNGMPVVK
jgi:hypothetical protein